MSVPPAGVGEPASPKVRLTVLGAGTLLPSRNRTSAAHLLEAESARWLLDCGAGTVHGFDRHGIDWRSIDGVALSHYHTDHLGDLPALLFALKHGNRPPRTAPLSLLGPPTLGTRLDAMVTAFGDHVLDPGFPVRIVELERNAYVEPSPELHLEVHPTPHTDHSVAQRWRVGDRVVAYTGDTGPPDDDLADFLSEADVLVAECSLPDGTDVQNHLTPGTVAELARRARPGLLVTTHVYPPLVPDQVPRLVAEAGWDGEVVAAVDGLSVEVGAGLRIRRPDGEPDPSR